jgi:hypothetical protein
MHTREYGQGQTYQFSPNPLVPCACLYSILTSTRVVTGLRYRAPQPWPLAPILPLKSPPSAEQQLPDAQGGGEEKSEGDKATEEVGAAV